MTRPLRDDPALLEMLDQHGMIGDDRRRLVLDRIEASLTGEVAVEAAPGKGRAACSTCRCPTTEVTRVVCSGCYQAPVVCVCPLATPEGQRQ